MAPCVLLLPDALASSRRVFRSPLQSKVLTKLGNSLVEFFPVPLLPLVPLGALMPNGGDPMLALIGAELDDFDPQTLPLIPHVVVRLALLDLLVMPRLGCSRRLNRLANTRR